MEQAADFHVHLQSNLSVDTVCEILDFAEKGNVKVLGLLEYNDIRFLKDGFYEKNKEIFKSHFSGKLIPGIEVVTEVDGGVISTDTGFDYSSYRCDICLYDFDINKMLKFYDKKELMSKWQDDADAFNA